MQPSLIITLLVALLSLVDARKGNGGGRKKKSSKGSSSSSDPFRNAFEHIQNVLVTNQCFTTTNPIGGDTIREEELCITGRNQPIAVVNLDDLQDDPNLILGACCAPGVLDEERIMDECTPLAPYTLANACFETTFAAGLDMFAVAWIGTRYYCCPTPYAVALIDPNA